MRVMPSDTVYNRTAYASDNFRYNAPLVLGFKGINNSSSTIKSSLSNFFERLGYTAVSPNIILYNGSMPVSDMLLSLKYIISEKQILDYPKINSISEINVFENPNALSLAFCASEDAFNTLPDKETVNPFEFQNILINNITGKSETYFYKTGEPAEFLNNLRKMDKSLEDKKDKEDKEESDSEYYEKLYNDSGVIEYDIKIPIGKEAFAFFPKKKVLKCKLYINDKECSDYFSPDNYGIISLGKYTNKEDVKLKLVFEDEKFSIKTPVFYYLDGDALHNAWQQLSKSQLKINRWDDAAVEGEIEVPESKNVLFTSIPFDSGWKAKVDGKEVPLKKIFNTFIGIDIPSGIHKVSFSYFPKGLISGIIISIISIIAATILILRTRKE
jgi:uncharacterized membrane protein YfhO